MKRKKKALWISFFNASLLTLFVYFLNNQPLFTGENLDHFTWLQWVKDKIRENHHTGDDSVFYVNVGYDKQLAPYTNDFGAEVGSVPVTDREKLYRFLDLLNKSGKYKYVFCDICFEKGIETSSDSALFDLLGKMPKIVIATYDGLEDSPGVPKDKTALSQYYSTIVATNFVRYKYSFDGRPSLPLYAYHDITGNDIDSHTLFYTSAGSLCNNSLFLNFPAQGFPMYDENGYQTYYNLGSDILNLMDSVDISRLTENKYVIIGDFINDTHDTYVGKLPGTFINYRAFEALMNKKHMVSLPVILLFGIIYFLISMSLFSRTSLLTLFPAIKNSKSRLLHFVATLVEYPLILTVATILMCIFFNVYASIIVPSVYFIVLKTIINYSRYKL